MPQVAQKRMPVRRVGPLTTRRRQRGTAGLEQGLNRLELRRIDDRRHYHLDNLGLWLLLACLPMSGVEAMPPDIGRPGQHFVHGADSPASPVAGADTVSVEMRGDGFDAHRSRRAVALAHELEDEADGLCLQRIDLEGFLGLVAALAGLHEADSRSGLASRSKIPGVRSRSSPGGCVSRSL